MEFMMPGANAFRQPEIAIARFITEGTDIRVLVSLTDELHPDDGITPWTIALTDTSRRLLEGWSGNWRTDKAHEIAFKASFTGYYVLTVQSNCAWEKELTLKLEQSGWSQTAWAIERVRI